MPQLPADLAAPLTENSPTAMVELTAQTTAMASTIHIRCIVSPGAFQASDRWDQILQQALHTFSAMESTASRFDAASDLSALNDACDRWHRPPELLLSLIKESHRAHQKTSGRFDPRVLNALLACGYDKGDQFLPERVNSEVTPAPMRPSRSAGHGQIGSRLVGPWPVRFRSGGRVHLGGLPIDLGGIGKGVAVRNCSAEIAVHSHNYLVEAGGDCYCAGHSLEGTSWRIAVEDPFGGSDPIAVLALSDLAVATSSVRVRQWQREGRSMHHLIDPTTGLPGGEGLRAVTVVGPDPAEAEVWSKTLFLAGASGIAALATRQNLAALWVDDEGTIAMTNLIRRHVIWRSS